MFPSRPIAGKTFGGRPIAVKVSALVIRVPGCSQ